LIEKSTTESRGERTEEERTEGQEKYIDRRDNVLSKNTTLLFIVQRLGDWATKETARLKKCVLKHLMQ
jgi:hypothetical protein